MRHGAKVTKTYHAPATPCDRLLQHPNVSEEDKDRLRQQRAELDPVDLLRELRQCQETLAQLSGKTVAPAVHEQQLDDFMRALPRLWKQGDARPNHRRKPNRARHWRTRKTLSRASLPKPSIGWSAILKAPPKLCSRNSALSIPTNFNPVNCEPSNVASATGVPEKRENSSYQVRLAERLTSGFPRRPHSNIPR